MKETIFKNLVLSLISTNIWTICAFFIYFFKSPGWFGGFEVLIFYMYSCYISGGIGIILILLRLFYFKKDKKNKLCLSFTYSCIATFNLLLFIIFLILIFSQIAKGGFLELFFFINPIIAAFTCVDIFKTTRQVAIQPNK
ncbi:hypothetical protein [Flavobacterium poyangense]|uniref:hypothetical protein n=1 Tax=Flavobacterium poyangense TaxID=2204302 RepID=UPI0014236195|nr:hypothetical protein [Flavobacterium sp. JXAS1]